jgi:Flp pilus assembly protein TadD
MGHEIEQKIAMKSRISKVITLSLFLPVSTLVAQQDSAIELKDDTASAIEASKVTLEDDTPKLKLDPAAVPTTTPARAGESASDLLNDTKESEEAILKKLSAADRAKLGQLLQDASTFVSGIRIQEALERLLEAKSIAPELFTTHNLLGAVYTKIRDFPKAREHFAKAVEIAPRAFMARFNLTEIDFVEDKHAEALAGFKPLIEKLKEEDKQIREAAKDQRRPYTEAERKGLVARADATASTIKLIEFKVLICHLKLGDQASAKAVLDTFNYLEDTPGFYYGNAAFAFQADDQDKAQQWLGSAEKIYGRGLLEIYTDSLIETGWIQTLQ